MPKGQGTTENDAVRKRALRSRHGIKSMGKRLLLKSTQSWPQQVVSLFVIGGLLYGSLNSQQWPIILTLIVTGLALTRVFVPSYLEIDYDKDFIEVKWWSFWKYDVTRLHNLKGAKAIRIEVMPGGDTPGYYYRKFLEFRNGSEIRLPDTKEIEYMLCRWYKKNYHVQLPMMLIKF